VLIPSHRIPEEVHEYRRNLERLEKSSH